MTRVKIEKLVFGGTGLARLPDGRVCFVWNALPGEEVDIEILKQQKGHAEAIAKKISLPSPDRVEPQEIHWLSSSPWQMMTPEAEARFKREIAAETYSKIANLFVTPDEIDIVGDTNKSYGYRNKIEFSFSPVGQKYDGAFTASHDIKVATPVSLAFFERGKWSRLPADGSLLARPEINATAEKILAWVNKNKIPLRSLKTLIVRSGASIPEIGRENTFEGQKTIAALFLKDELPFETFPKIDDTMVGFHLYYSTHKSPASVPTRLLHSTGQDHLFACLKGTWLKYGIFSFFQINLPVFDMALDDIAAWLEPKTPLVDYYSGVGSISLPLSLNREESILVDINEDAIRFAEENIKLNNRAHAQAHCEPAENMLEHITSSRIIIVDPPRAGLHQKVISRLLLKLPPRIIYLSCDLATQARDLKILSQAYKVKFLRLYNFFPRTPHIEGLCVLDRI